MMPPLYFNHGQDWMSVGDIRFYVGVRTDSFHGNPPA
jgi:hypothetical protein